jgi:hypothetical protein
MIPTILLDVFGSVKSKMAQGDHFTNDNLKSKIENPKSVSPAHQRLGYATEAAGAMLDYAFGELRLKRIVATTTYDNGPSIVVMCKLGMQIEHKPHVEPPWLQVVGLLSHPNLRFLIQSESGHKCGRHEQ